MKSMTNWMLLGVMVLLVAFGGVLYFTDIFGTTVSGNYYYYSNGDTEFFVEDLGNNNRIYMFFEGSSQPYFLNMRYGPAEVENIPVYGDIYNAVRYSDQVFLTMDPYAGLDIGVTVAGLEIDKIIDNKYFFNLPVNSSMMEPYADYQVRTCDNATASEIVMVLDVGEETSVTLDGNCVLVTGVDEEGIVMAANRLGYHLLGIIP